jgi:RND superfamily putative drug exporter
MTISEARPRRAPDRPRSLEAGDYGPLGRLGRWTAGHLRAVLVIWVVIAVGLGVFAPRAEHALSGAGWEAAGSESVETRRLIDERFGGRSSYALTVVVHSQSWRAGDPAFEAALGRTQRILGSRGEIAPRPAVSFSRDRHTALVVAGAAADPTAMVAAAGALKGELKAAGGDGVDVRLTGAPGMWSDFNDANKKAMLRSEFLSWPVTMAILVVAFGSLVAAGLPLMLTILGLMAAAGSLFVAGQLADVSIWAMNFALMFALALGIDYALFIVHRFRGSFFGGSKLTAADAVAVTMDTAGKAVLFSGVTVLISLSAVLLVPSPAFRSMSLGIMLSVLFVLAAALTLLPAVLARLGPRVDKLALPWAHSGEHRSPRFGRWAERLWRRPLPFGLLALALLLALAYPLLGLRTGMPSIKVVPADDQSRQGYELVQRAFGPGAPATLQIVARASEQRAVVTTARRDPGIAQVMPAQRSQGLALVQAVPRHEPSSTEVGSTIERLRSALPAGALVGGAAAENHDLERALTARLPLVLGVVLALGFLLLLLALQAPLLAALGVVTNLLATGAAFGVARLIFQDGRAEGLLGFESQGFLNAWGPVFFFAMIFAISMDYTVFLLASAKEHWDRSGDAREAAVGGLAHSGRVIFAAAGVMVAIFFTFALSGPLPPKEMGIILGLAVLLDAALIRLVLLPVLLRLSGPAAWWLPPWIGRWLPKVRFGHAEVRR